MELVLVRHALPVRVDRTDHGGPADPSLSDIGWQQAVRVIEGEYEFPTQSHASMGPACAVADVRDDELGAVEQGVPLQGELDAVQGGLVPIQHDQGGRVELVQLPAQLRAAGPGITILSGPNLDVSATEIRRRVAAGESIDGLVAPAVARYIEAHHLYRQPASSEDAT